MAEKKFSAIASAGSISGTDTIIGVQSGPTDVQYTFTNTAAYVAANLGVASATSLALGGATIGSNALAVTGTILHTGAQTQTGALVFSATNTYDIGTNATTLAPRTVYAGTSFVGPAGTFTTSITVGAGSAITSSGAGGAIASAAFVATGTSGATIPLLSGTNTWSGTQTYGSGVLVATSPSLTTPSLGVATATSINGNTFTTGTYTLTGTAAKTLNFTNSLTLSGTDATTMTFPATSSTVLTTGNTATITKGYTVTPNNLGNITSFTVDPTLGNYQYGTNHGAATWTAPVSDCAVDILVTNDGSAGTITFSGFTVGSNTGSALTTTNGQKFIISIRRINSVATYSVYALQ